MFLVVQRLGSLAPSLPRRFIQHNARCYAGIQRFHMLRVWDRDSLVELRHQRPRQACALAADEDGHRSRELGLIERGALVRRGRNQPQPIRAQFHRDYVEPARGLGHDHGKPKQRSCRRANHFRIERIHRPVAQDRTRAAKGFRRAQNRSQIARILQAGDDNDWADLQPFRYFFECKTL